MQFQINKFSYVNFTVQFILQTLVNYFVVNYFFILHCDMTWCHRASYNTFECSAGRHSNRGRGRYHAIQAGRGAVNQVVPRGCASLTPSSSRPPLPTSLPSCPLPALPSPLLLSSLLSRPPFPYSCALLALPPTRIRLRRRTAQNEGRSSRYPREPRQARTQSVQERVKGQPWQCISQPPLARKPLVALGIRMEGRGNLGIESRWCGPAWFCWVFGHTTWCSYLLQPTLDPGLSPCPFRRPLERPSLVVRVPSYDVRAKNAIHTSGLNCCLTESKHRDTPRQTGPSIVPGRRLSGFGGAEPFLFRKMLS